MYEHDTRIFLFVLSSHNSVQLRRSLSHCMKNITETILDNMWCYKVSHRGKHIPHDVNHNELSKLTYQKVSIIYLRTIRLNHGPKSKVSFSVWKTAMTYMPPTIPGSNSTKIQPFLQKARRERIMALQKNWETFIPFKEVWFSEASNKGFSAYSFHNITWAVDLHSFFLIHVNSQQCYCFILKLSDFPVAWSMLRDITRHLKFVHKTALNFTKGYIFLTNVSSIFPSFFTLKQRLESAPNV